jgi:hypothetical protein
LDFQRYRVYDNCAVKEFYSLLIAAIKGARAVGHIGLLLNNQTIPKIVGKIPFSDWKEWATNRPEWVHDDVGDAFKKFVEQKWKDALNVAAAEPGGWEGNQVKAEKTLAERATGLAQKVIATSGSLNTATVDTLARGRK